MKISSVSDLHLEFCIAPELPGGDLLLLAGDITAAGYHRPQRNDADARKVQARVEKFCRTQLSKYERVLMIPGNHEHYRSFFEETVPLLRDWFAERAPNLTLLDDESVEIEGHLFIGSTLWARCGCDRPGMEEWRIGNGMNDFSKISTRMPPPPQRSHILMSNDVRLFAPYDAYLEHQRAVKFIEAEAAKGLPTVLMTHHAPSLLSAHGMEHGSAFCDDAYVSNLHPIFKKYPNIRLAVHGHTHHKEHYRVENTLILSNPRGYFPDEKVSRYFDPAEADITLEELSHGSADEGRDHG